MPSRNNKYKYNSRGYEWPMTAVPEIKQVKSSHALKTVAAAQICQKLCDIQKFAASKYKKNPIEKSMEIIMNGRADEINILHTLSF